ncbi:hypothetical protein [Nonomuraea dietziae]
MVGLEPFSSMPTDGLSAAVDNGTAMLLGPHSRGPRDDCVWR